LDMLLWVPGKVTVDTGRSQRAAWRLQARPSAVEPESAGVALGGALGPAHPTRRKKVGNRMDRMYPARFPPAALETGLFPEDTGARGAVGCADSGAAVGEGVAAGA
jgi:hypothetical protein